MTTTTIPKTDTLERLHEIKTAVSSAYVERGHVVDAAITAAVAGQHIFLLGPPGVAKSEILRTLSHCFEASYFEVLLSRLTKPEDIFGPLDVPGLMQGCYRRSTERYLPSVEIALLDEIWNAGPAVLNGLLKILNERLFDNDGRAEKTPLKMAALASNCLPESSELEALYDRIVIRCVVEDIASDTEFRKMLGLPGIDIDALPRVSFADVTALSRNLSTVAVPDDVLDALVSLRRALRTNCGIVRSPRRWRKIVEVLQARAMLAGRSSVELADFGFLANTLWDRPEEITTVTRELADFGSEPGMRAVLNLFDQAVELVESARRRVEDGETKTAVGADTNEKLVKILQRMEELGDGPEKAKIRESVKRTQRDALAEFIGLKGD